MSAPAEGVATVVGGIVRPPTQSELSALAPGVEVRVLELGPPRKGTLAPAGEASEGSAESASAPAPSGEEASGTAPEGDPDQDWRSLELHKGEAVLRLHRVIPGDERYAHQVRALTGFLSAAAQASGDRVLGLLVGQRLAAANNVIGVARVGEAAWEGLEDLVKGLAQHQNGLVFFGQALCDHELRALIRHNGAPDAEATLPVLHDSLQRQHASELRIGLFDLEPPPLPPLPSVEEIAARPASEVAARAQALWAVASRADGLDRKAAVELLQGRGLWQAATFAEQDFLLEDSPTPEEREPFAERVEALRTLLWALGKVEIFGPPTQRADFAEITRLLRRHSGEAFMANATLRPLNELLDEACCHVRCHGALVRLQRSGGTAPPTLRPRVIAERNLALAWTLDHPRGNWDELAAVLAPTPPLPGSGKTQ